MAAYLIETLRTASLELKKKKVVNELVKEVTQCLQVRTSAAQVKDVDLYSVAMNRKRIARFREIVHFLRRPAVILEESLQGFRIEIRKHSFDGAGEIKQASGTKLAFSDAFSVYEDAYQPVEKRTEPDFAPRNPRRIRGCIPPRQDSSTGCYTYLQKLKGIECLAPADHFRLFTKITCHTLNRDGHDVSGGERSEFRLLQEISDAQNHDLLLVDEPESSFDNLFLKREVNQILKSISETMPVVVVTHNSTVGASVDADYILHTAKEVVDGKPVYRIYSGYPTDKPLVSVDGKEVSSHETLRNSLEAGMAPYEGRKQSYEAVKDQ